MWVGDDLSYPRGSLRIDSVAIAEFAIVLHRCCGVQDPFAGGIGDLQFNFCLRSIGRVAQSWRRCDHHLAARRG